MIQLQKKFYTRAELAEIIGVDGKDKNFSRKVKTTLDNWGYKIDNYSRKGVDIVDIPATAHEQLKEIMLRVFNLDIQVNIYAFACYLCLLMEYEDFTSMPWNQRVTEMKEIYNISVSKDTLEKWSNKLIEQKVVYKDKNDKTNWKTTKNTVTGANVHIRVDGDEELEEEMQRYKDRRRELYKTMSPDAVSAVLWEEFGCFYYMCGTLVLNAIERKMDKIYELVKEIEGEESK